MSNAERIVEELEGLTRDSVLMHRAQELYKGNKVLNHMKSLANSKNEYTIAFFYGLFTGHQFPYSSDNREYIWSIATFDAWDYSNTDEGKRELSKIAPPETLLSSMQSHLELHMNAAWNQRNAKNSSKSAVRQSYSATATNSSKNAARQSNNAMNAAWVSANQNAKLANLKQSAKNTVASTLASIPVPTNRKMPNMMASIANTVKNAKNAIEWNELYGPGPQESVSANENSAAAAASTRVDNQAAVHPMFQEHNEPENVPATSASKAAQAANRALDTHRNMSLTLAQMSAKPRARLGGARRTKKRSRKQKKLKPRRPSRKNSPKP